MRVKIFGAGSIGNHLSHAARTKGWDVTLCDVELAALERTRDEIYPRRYGAWDESINLTVNASAPTGVFDLIIVGTPPDSHIRLALSAVDEGPRAILVEKPFGVPDLEGCQALYDKALAAKVPVFVGYDHVVGRGLTQMAALAGDGGGPVQTIDVAFREHWDGIFNAHPWLDGPQDTYLGYWRRGGGALSEHSHALNLWQYLAHVVRAGRVVAVSATLDYVREGSAEYDRLALLNLETETGLVGRVVQDVITRPVQKLARVQRQDVTIEWRCRSTPYSEVVRKINSNCVDEAVYEKSRPEDFINELDHIEHALETGESSPIAIDRGLETMLVIAAAHLSARQNRRVQIDHARGFTTEALGL
jgi:predicted dehydrogenase